MKNNDRIIRYLSGMMSPGESIEFENELKHSKTLPQEFLKFKEQLSGLNTKPEREEHQYFINLMPRVRERMQKRKINFYSTFKYLVPACVLILVYIIIPFRSSSELEEQINDLSDSSQTELLNFIEDDEIVLNNNDEVFESAISDQLTYDDLNNLGAKYMNTEDLLENLSEEEADKIYNTILNTKIL